MKAVVIVGGGVIGLFCAVRLAREGARVTLLEAEPDDPSVFRPAASLAAAGMLSPFQPSSDARDRLALDSYDLWRRSADGAPWADGIRFDGAVVAGERAEDVAALQARIVQFGRNATRLSPSQARARTGLKGVFDNAIIITDDGVVDPLRVMSGLALQARQYGVALRYGEDVAEVRPTRVSTHDGDVYQADAVVLAPGAWATKALQEAAPALRHVRPAKGHLVAVTLPKRLKATVRAHDFYLAARRDDIVLGSTVEYDRYDRHVNKERVAQLLAALEAFAPGQATFTGSAWAGIRPMSPDGWPIVGPSRGVLVAAGHSRNGWLMAPITAEIVTAYVFCAEIPAEWTAISPQRFES